MYAPLPKETRDFSSSDSVLQRTEYQLGRNYGQTKPKLCNTLQARIENSY